VIGVYLRTPQGGIEKNSSAVDTKVLFLPFDKGIHRRLSASIGG
jgi:hypothetical protein